MPCEMIRPVVRKFLDDLLDEKDYQDIQAHLAQCAQCRQYASSVGTLSYRLHELGQVTLPPDMASTILYEIKKMPPKAESSAVYPQSSETPGDAFNAQTRLFWIAVFALGVVSIAAIVGAFFWRSHSAPGLTPPTHPKEPAALTVLAPSERMTERHYHLTLSGRPELGELIIEMQLAVERDSERSLVFLVPAEKAAQFRERMAAFSGVVKEFGEPASSENAENERITVFFE